MKLPLYFLQVSDLQSVHVQAQDITGSREAVAGVDEVTELWLGEKLLLCQGQRRQLVAAWDQLPAGGSVTLDWRGVKSSP